MVLVEILFKGKRKAVKHKASTKISELLAMYRQRFGTNAMRVMDERGLEQGGEVTLGLLHSGSRSAAAAGGADAAKNSVRLTFEEDDWFD